MNEFHHIYYYLKQVDSYLRSQQQQIEKLQEELNNLQDHVNEIREGQTTNIERIEYKFDQLKIETLEGTLNIGLTPHGLTDPETIENLSVNQQSPVSSTIHQTFPALFPRLKDAIQQYLTVDSASYMDNCAANYQVPLTNQHKIFILQDIERQLDERIHYYIKQAANEKIREDSQEELFQFVFSKIKNDIEKAIDTFIKHLPRGGI